jgi:hypothetical protein
MDLNVAFSEADLHEIHQRVDADDYAISRACSLVVIELSADDLLIGSKGRVETIRVVGYNESLALRFQRRARPGTGRVRLSL